MRSSPLLLVSALAACGDNLELVPVCAALPDAGARGDGDLALPSYDEVVRADRPVAFWDLSNDHETEPDLSGHGNCGVYLGGTPGRRTMPNGDLAAAFDGANEYLYIPSNASLSIPSTGNLTWEAWLLPDVVQFPNSPNGYVNWMGKCARYSPTCEWEARLHDTENPQGRCNRFSAYAFNPDAGLGAGADWQPVCGLVQPHQWHHVVGEYTISRQPADCPIIASAPGSISIWVDGIEWSQADHSPTGCMSQFNVVPVANDSPMTIGTSAFDSWFQGAIGKVAIYSYLLTPDQIANHYEVMTSTVPSGSCGATCTLGP